MGAYSTMDTAIPGLIAEGIQNVSSIRSRVAKQNISFGAPVMGYQGDPDDAYNYKLDTAICVFDGDFVADNSIVLTINGVALDAVLFDTDQATTLAALVTAVQAAGYDAYGTVRTIYVRDKGVDITLAEAITGGVGQATGTITYRCDQVFLGVAVYTSSDISAANTGRYDANETINIMERGLIWAYINSTNLSEDDAYLDNSGADKGRFSATAGDAVNCKFRSDNYTNATTTDTISVIEVNGIYKPNAQVAW